MWNLQEYSDFTGGENQAVIPDKMLPNQQRLAQNCVITPEGILETRKGKTEVNTTTIGTGGITSLHRYATEGGTNYLLAQHSTNLYGTTWDGDTPFASFGAAIKASLDAAKLYSVVWKDNIIFSNGVDAPFRWDGTTITNLAGTPPNLLYIKVYAGRLWGVDAANPNYIRFSDLEDYDVWNALNVIKVRDGDGDFITGLSPQTGGMLIFKNKSVFPLYGTNRHNITVQDPWPSKIGNIAPSALLDEGLLLADDTVYQFSLNGLGPGLATHKPQITALTPSEKASAFATAIPGENRAVITFGNSGTLCIDSFNRGATTWTGLNAGCYALNSAEGDDGSLLVGDADNGLIYKLTNTVDDEGTSISTAINTSYLDQDSPKEKIWRYFKPKIEQVNESDSLVYLSYDLDDSTSSGLINVSSSSAINFLDWGVDNWGEAFWGIGTKINEFFYFHGVRGNRISFGITANNRIKLLSVLIKYREAGKI